MSARSRAKPWWSDGVVTEETARRHRFEMNARTVGAFRAARDLIRHAALALFEVHWRALPEEIEEHYLDWLEFLKTARMAGEDWLLLDGQGDLAGDLERASHL